MAILGSIAQSLGEFELEFVLMARLGTKEQVDNVLMLSYIIVVGSFGSEGSSHTDHPCSCCSYSFLVN